MIECIYSTDVLLNSPKEKILSIILYGIININGVEVCKIPLEIDVFANEAYFITIEYEIFIKSWQQQRIESSKQYVDQLIRFYKNVESFKAKLQKNN
jgi:hypothetical protein